MIHNKIKLQETVIKQKGIDGIVHELSDLCTEISEVLKRRFHLYQYLKMIPNLYACLLLVVLK